MDKYQNRPIIMGDSHRLNLVRPMMIYFEIVKSHSFISLAYDIIDQNNF